jgi:dienelactone hydrolase
MVAGIDRYLTRATERSIEERKIHWQRDGSSGDAYARSVEPNRQRLRRMVGAVDERVSPVDMDYDAGPGRDAVVAETDSYRVYAVRWTVFRGVSGEGLLVEPKGTALANVIAIPDADQTPEVLLGLAGGLPAEAQFARNLAEAGCRVIVPVLVDRQCTWSGNPDVVLTDQTHREWIYRQGFEMGRHVIGYEVQKVLAAVDWLEASGESGRTKTAVAGYGEGGLIALYAAALDRRIAAALVSGYFQSRQRVWSEPLYRNLQHLLSEFGDAEIASLIAPRTLIVEHSRGPEVHGPPSAAGRRQCAAPGELVSPPFDSVRGEVDRARTLVPESLEPKASIHLVAGDKGAAIGPGSPGAFRLLFEAAGAADAEFHREPPATLRIGREIDSAERQRRQLEELVEHSQRLLRRAEQIRQEFWKPAGAAESAEQWQAATRSYRERLWSDVLGRLPDPSLPANPRTRKIRESDRWTMYEVVLDVWPDVLAWGYLTVPKDIRPGERRPVVVCQHGLEGLPESVVTEDQQSRAFQAYRAYAVRLAERGLITYAPHNPYRGETAFRQLQRKANPLGLTLFSFILGQHQRTLEWLGTLPFVDAERIGFYGLSYGGTSAMRIPSLLDGYCLSICSACYNDWTRKIMSTDFRSAYMFTREYEQFTFNLGSTFNHAEMAALIAPRPFMVERGHRDGVAPDEWVAHEYAKVRRLYAELEIPERTEIEFFDGGHVINGQGTFDFLHRHLEWPGD